MPASFLVTGGGDYFVLSQKRFWFAPSLIPRTESQCTSILLGYEPLPSLAWLPSLLWTSAYTLLTAPTPLLNKSCHSWLIKLVLCQVNHSLKSWVSHLIMSSFYHWMKYSAVWPILYVFLCSVLQIQTSSNMRLSQFLNHDFILLTFLQEEIFEMCLFIPLEHIQSLREFLFSVSPSMCLKTSSFSRSSSLLGIFQFVLQTRCSTSHSASSRKLVG